ncbi:MAG: NAD(P)/FAD-dependent oxidoreductase [Pseudomonadota bacterium]
MAASDMRQQTRIAIVGYGIAGVSAAIHLRPLGLDITHFERRPAPGARGAGMILHPAAQRLLQPLGVLKAAQQEGVPIRRIRARTADGHDLFSLDYDDIAKGASSLGIQRAALHRILAAVDSGIAEVQTGIDICSLDTKQGVLRDTSGQQYGPFDLVLIADGVHSRLRALFDSNRRQQPVSTSAALVGVLPAPKALAKNTLRQVYDPTRHVSVWPVATNPVDRTATLAFAINLAPKETQHVDTLPPWQDWLTAAYPGFGALLRDLPPDSDSPRVVTYREVQCRHWVNGRAVLIGDAAHAMSPLLGAGAQFAIEDAAQLARSIARRNDIRAAADDFARLRARQLTPFQRASRWLTPLFMSSNRALATGRDQLFRRLANSALSRTLLRRVLS